MRPGLTKPGKRARDCVDVPSSSLIRTEPNRTAAVAPVDFFPALSAVPGLVHGFLTRVPGVMVDTDRADAVSRLAPHHAEALASLGIPADALNTAEQVHGSGIIVCGGPADRSGICAAGMDGLVTGIAGIWLGIYVADCAAVWIVDPLRRVCAVVHSGKKGTELGIVPATIGLMKETFGSDPDSLVVQVSPCIRPPAYEVDFAEDIRRQCAASGVPTDRIHDEGVCTARDPGRYYSYRTERGRTGRMLAVVGFRSA
ncbi:MAG: laccase domain-containing protein [Akkermansiaceae bacterium]|nr:laccase domain-containing protein [Akkermansiaceae bacterium]